MNIANVKLFSNKIQTASNKLFLHEMLHFY